VVISVRSPRAKSRTRRVSQHSSSSRRALPRSDFIIAGLRMSKRSKGNLPPSRLRPSSSCVSPNSRCATRFPALGEEHWIRAKRWPNRADPLSAVRDRARSCPDVTLHEEHAECCAERFPIPTFVGRHRWADGTIETSRLRRHAAGHQNGESRRGSRAQEIGLLPRRDDPGQTPPPAVEIERLGADWQGSFETLGRLNHSPSAQLVRRSIGDWEGGRSGPF